MKRTWWRRQKSNFFFLFRFHFGKKEKMLKKCYRYYNLPPALVTYLSFIPLEERTLSLLLHYIFLKLYIYWCETNKRIYATCAYEISSFPNTIFYPLSSSSPIFPNINTTFYPQFMNKLRWQMYFRFSSSAGFSMTDFGPRFIYSTLMFHAHWLPLALSSGALCNLSKAFTKFASLYVFYLHGAD